MILRALIAGFAIVLTLVALSAGAQTPDEHSRHHPGGVSAGGPSPQQIETPSGPTSAPPGEAGMSSGGATADELIRLMGRPRQPDTDNPIAEDKTQSASPGKGMGGMMGAMMAPQGSSGGCMGGGCGSRDGTTPIYPSLMSIPALTPESRAELDTLARKQTEEGLARLATSAESLDRARQVGDDAAMQQSVGRMHEALSELEAGIAARRVLSEGKAPRNLALDWFKREMSLASPVVRDEPRALLGLSPLHLFTMGLLTAFAFAMIAMYFFKMRRAAALFGRLEPDAESPPPGSAPPLGGAAGPSAPPGGVAPPSRESPPPTASSGPSASAPPETGEAATRVKDGLPPPPGAPNASPGESSPAAATTSPPVPLTAKWRGSLRVEAIVSETPSVKTYRLRSARDGPLPFTFVPGQFLNIAFGIGGARTNRSYSISSSPNKRGYVDLTVKREERGAVSRHIHDLIGIAHDIEAGGPVGKFTFAGNEADSIVLISAGVGITPMMSIARYLTERSWPGDIFFIYGCRAPADFIFEKALAALETRNPKLHVVVTMSKPGPDWKGPKGRLSKELLTQVVPDLASRRVHVCGPPAMMEATKSMLTEVGVTPDRLKTEAFGAVKPPVADPGTSAKPTVPATGPLVTFSKNDKVAKIRTDQTILELSEELGIGIEFSCRVGTCGVCKVKMTAGEVDMAVDDALDDEDKENGIILACQAKPKAEITVEA